MKQSIVFEKMHGIGNDFVLVDNFHQKLNVTHDKVKLLANRHTGIGFDQLLLLEASSIEGCDAAYRFFNPDGSEAKQCGNGQRCISYYLWKKNTNKKIFCVSGLAGLIHSEVLQNEQVKVNMGKTQAVNTLTISAVQCQHILLGNPHLVTVCNNVDACDLNLLNKQLTGQYPDGINLEIVEIIARDEIKIRVHERGTGETLACGSGACAAVAALQANGQLDNKVKVMLPGGLLVVEYDETDNNIYLTGAATHVFTGELTL
jgi:diaminopimelate epimerase